jgi:hypothetical protein
MRYLVREYGGREFDSPSVKAVVALYQQGRSGVVRSVRTTNGRGWRIEENGNLFIAQVIDTTVQDPRVLYGQEQKR